MYSKWWIAINALHLCVKHYRQPRNVERLSNKNVTRFTYVFAKTNTYFVISNSCLKRIIVAYFILMLYRPARYFGRSLRCKNTIRYFINRRGKEYCRRLFIKTRRSNKVPLANVKKTLKRRRCSPEM